MAGVCELVLPQIADRARHLDRVSSGTTEVNKPAEFSRRLRLGRNLFVPLHDSTHDQLHQAFNKVLTQADFIGDNP